jgi:hypothetical protein
MLQFSLTLNSELLKWLQVVFETVERKGVYSVNIAFYLEKFQLVNEPKVIK